MKKSNGTKAVNNAVKGVRPNANGGTTVRIGADKRFKPPKRSRG